MNFEEYCVNETLAREQQALHICCYLYFPTVVIPILKPFRVLIPMDFFMLGENIKGRCVFSNQIMDKVLVVVCNGFAEKSPNL